MRTVMRWAKADGLPVSRIGEGKRRAVYAYTVDIDEWLARGRPGPASVEEPPALSWRPSRRQWAAFAAGAAVVLAALFSLSARFMSASPGMARAAIVGRDLVAFDVNGRDLWRYPLARADEDPTPTKVRIVQWNPNARPQLLVPAGIQRQGGGGTGALMLMDDTGRLLWRRTLDSRFRFGDTEYGPTWYPTDVLTYQVAGEWRIAAAWRHRTWWPGTVTTFDRDGREVGEFVNAGWIHQLSVTRDGRYVLAAGVSNALGGAVLAVFEASRIDGASPVERSMLPACSNCPAGAPVKYFLVPWSDLARAADTPSVVAQVADSGEIELRAAQQVPREGPIPELM